MQFARLCEQRQRMHRDSGRRWAADKPWGLPDAVDTWQPCAPAQPAENLTWNTCTLAKEQETTIRCTNSHSRDRPTTVLLSLCDVKNNKKSPGATWSFFSRDIPISSNRFYSQPRILFGIPAKTRSWSEKSIKITNNSRVCSATNNFRCKFSTRLSFYYAASLFLNCWQLLNSALVRWKTNKIT